MPTQTFLERLKDSGLWNEEFQLPLFRNQNPWIYLGYIGLVAKLNGEELPSDRILFFYCACEVPGVPGLFKRWPNSGDPTSHDEILGACAFDPVIAERVADHLARTDGEFDSQEKFKPGMNPMRFDLSRFAWLRAYVQAAAGRRVNPVNQALWCLNLLASLRDSRKGGNQRAHTMRWLQAYQMQRFFLPYLCILLWQFVLRVRGIHLDEALLHEPGNAVLAAHAPQAWTLPELP